MDQSQRMYTVNALLDDRGYGWPLREISRFRIGAPWLSLKGGGQSQLSPTRVQVAPTQFLTQSPEPRLRDKVALFLRKVGIPRHGTDFLMGSQGYGPSNPYHMGLVDFLPLVNIPFSKDEMDRAKESGDTAGTVFNAIGLVPGARPAAQAVAGGAKALKSGLYSYDIFRSLKEEAQRPVERLVPARGSTPRMIFLRSDRPTFDRTTAEVAEGLPSIDPAHYDMLEFLMRGSDVVGNERARQVFDRFAKMYGATSPRSTRDYNVKGASLYTHRSLDPEEVLPEVGAANPPSYGHFAQLLHQNSAHKVASGGQLSTIYQPKSATMPYLFYGNEHVVPLDTHNWQGIGMNAQHPYFLTTWFRPSGEDIARNIRSEVERKLIPFEAVRNSARFYDTGPRLHEYLDGEEYMREVAQALGIPPALAHLVLYYNGLKRAGHGPHIRGRILGDVDHRIALTALRRGMEPRDVHDKFWQGKGAFLALGGAAGLSLPEIRYLLSGDAASRGESEDLASARL